MTEYEIRSKERFKKKSSFLGTTSFFLIVHDTYKCVPESPELQVGHEMGDLSIAVECTPFFLSFIFCFQGGKS